jgi:methylated-DNA-protein-cysteine methyltransferase-like protein
MVGYAMAALPGDSDVPWQRVINAQGKVSLRADSLGNEVQRILLAEEGVRFQQNGAVDWKEVRWAGPSLPWLLANDFNPQASWTEG